MNSTTAEKQVAALKSSNFKQQKMYAFRPIPSYLLSVACFVIFGIIFIVLGLILYAASNRIVSITQQYDNLCPNYNVTCDIKLTIENDIDQPLYVYYEIDGLL